MCLFEALYAFVGKGKNVFRGSQKEIPANNGRFVSLFFLRGRGLVVHGLALCSLQRLPSGSIKVTPQQCPHGGFGEDLKVQPRFRDPKDDKKQINPGSSSAVVLWGNES